MQSSFRIARIAGIDVGIHYTWVFAFVLITWSLAQGYFPISFPGFAPATYWLLGIAAAIGLFASVLFHEFSHSLVARARGLDVHGITLFIFGGVSNLGGEAEDPGDEFAISIVGPLSSFVLSGIFWGLRQVVAPGDTPLGALLGYLAFINLALGAFNLVPGFPLDGGRVLRSLVWGASRNLRFATRVASLIGQGIGFLLIFYGLLRLLSGDVFGGLWIAFIGWFLNSAADSIRQQQAVTEDLKGVRVRQLMNPSPPITRPEVTVSDFVLEHVMRRGQRALLVADEQGRLDGLVSVTDAKEIPRDAWPRTPVSQVMTPVPLKTVAPESDVAAALRLLVDGGFHQLPVVTDGRVVGMLDRSDILRFLQLRGEFGPATTGQQPPSGQAGGAARVAR